MGIQNHIVLTDFQMSVAIAQMEAVALTVTPHLAFGASLGFHPFSVAVNLEAVLPYLPEAVMIDVALMIVTSDAQAS